MASTVYWLIKKDGKYLHQTYDLIWKETREGACRFHVKSNARIIAKTYEGKVYRVTPVKYGVFCTSVGLWCYDTRLDSFQRVAPFRGTKKSANELMSKLQADNPQSTYRVERWPSK